MNKLVASSEALPSGSWNHTGVISSENQNNASQNTLRSYAIITAIAILAIGSAAAGGLMLYLHVNTIASWVLIGVGATGVAGDLIAVAILKCKQYMRGQKKKTSLQKSSNTSSTSESSSTSSHSYTVATWNIGTRQDFGNMLAYKKLSESKSSFKEISETYEREPAYFPSKEERVERTEIFQRSFTELNSSDVILLQECWQFSDSQITEFLPSNYQFFRAGEEHNPESLIAWNPARFSVLATAKVTYDPQLKLAPNNIALLQDLTTGTKLCLGSSHLAGFSLASPGGEEKKGDYQIRYDLETMKKIEADVFIYAGDYNTTQEHYSARLDILNKEYGYTTDLNDHGATILDGNLKLEDGTPMPVKLDYVHAKAEEGYSVVVSSKVHGDVYNFKDRASDHLPVSATITVTTN